MVTAKTDFNCPRCNYIFCIRQTEDCNFGQIVCLRCGFTYSTEIARIGTREPDCRSAERHCVEGNLNEALKDLCLDGPMTINLSDEDKRKEIEKRIWPKKQLRCQFYFVLDASDTEAEMNCLGLCYYWYWKEDSGYMVTFREPKGKYDYEHRTFQGFLSYYERMKDELDDAGYIQKRGDKWFITSLKFGKQLELKDDDYVIRGSRLIIPFDEYIKEEAIVK